MANVHIISDLFLEYNESSEAEEVLPPDIDLVIFNGNIGNHIKRSFLYMETMCKKYPEVQFVVNLGQQELYSNYDKYVDEISNGIQIRRDNHPNWLKNLHYSKGSMLITLRDGTQVDVLCTYGFPKIYTYEGSWEDTYWHRNHCVKIVYGHDEIAHFKPDSTSNVLHGAVPIFATKRDIDDLHEKEWKLAQDWELTPTVIKILVTHINPYKDTRCDGSKVSAYNIHLEKGYWIGSNTPVDGIIFLGAKLFSNPGRGVEARSRIFSI